MSRSSSWLRKDKRQALLIRDDFKCVYCDLEKWESEARGQRLGIDHLTPSFRGGSNRYTNLVTCCHWCNSRKKAMTLAEYRDWVEMPMEKYASIRRQAKRRITKIRKAVKEDMGLQECGLMPF